MRDRWPVVCVKGEAGSIPRNFAEPESGLITLRLFGEEREERVGELGLRGFTNFPVG